MKLVREFTLPRERVVPEVTRAFQLILQSLRNLEKKTIELEAENEMLKTAVQKVDENVRVPLPRVPLPRVPPSRVPPRSRIGIEYAEALSDLVLTRTYEEDIDLFGFGVDENEVFVEDSEVSVVELRILIGLGDNESVINDLAPGISLTIVQGSIRIVADIGSRAFFRPDDVVVVYNVVVQSRIGSDFVDDTETTITIGLSRWSRVRTSKHKWYRLYIDDGERSDPLPLAQQ